MSDTQQSKTGQIGVETKNIFPLIKQSLYSERDIFLRELISNSFDAINKRQRLDKKNAKDVKFEINITVDEKAKTLTISDNGIGMSEEDVEKYINQIASSGAEDFVKKFSDTKDKQDIIGHFGVGFYSAFMVANTINIDTKSYENHPAITWIGQEDTHYEIKASSKTEVGTAITLHINSESNDCLNKDYITNLVKRYANFLPILINVNGKEANHQKPLWIQQNSELTDKDYKSFYSTLFPMQQEPLFWIHLNVDFPFRLQGILYFPQFNHELDSSKGKVQLYCQQVFVTENVKEILPEFLTLLQGAIDCPEIPLNVSRSQLQHDPYVQKISKHIIKKVADKLLELSKKDRKNFEVYWKSIHPFIKYGMMSDDDFYSKTKDICLFRSSSGLNTKLEEYKEKHKDKLKNQIIYSSQPETQSTYIDLLKKQGIDCIYLESSIDTHFIQFLESKDSETKYLSVDGEGIELLQNKTEEQIQSNINEKDQEAFIEQFKKTIEQDQIEVKLKPLLSDEPPAIISENEHMKRFREMNQFMSASDTQLPRQLNLILNTKSPITQRLINYYKLTPISDKAKLLSHHIYDLACLAQEPLSGEKMTRFIQRSTQIIDLMTKT